MHRTQAFPIICLLLLILLGMPSCKKEIVPEAFYPRSAHEAYQHALEEVNLIETALGRDWIQAGVEALENPVQIEFPYEEAFLWDPAKAESRGYRFFVKRGVRVEVDIDIQSADSMLLFADLFRETDDTVINRIHVATADEKEHRIEFEPRRDAYYALRLQPELLRGGRVEETLELEQGADGAELPGVATYRNFPAFRELQVRVEAIDHVESYPPDIWTPGS